MRPLSPKLVLAACLIASSSLGGAQAADPVITFTTLAGTAGAVTNSVDGTGSAAQFYAPRGAAVDSNGTVYVADSSNHTIRKISAAGVVTTFAIAIDSSGNWFVADTNNNAIRKITSGGVVSTLAGGNG